MDILRKVFIPPCACIHLPSSFSQLWRSPARGRERVEVSAWGSLDLMGLLESCQSRTSGKLTTGASWQNSNNSPRPRMVAKLQWRIKVILSIALTPHIHPAPLRLRSLEFPWQSLSAHNSKRYTDVHAWLVVSDPLRHYGHSLPGSSVHGILQLRILEWTAIPFSRGSSWPKDGSQVSYVAGRSFTIWATREANRYSER